MAESERGQDEAVCGVQERGIRISRSVVGPRQAIKMPEGAKPTRVSAQTEASLCRFFQEFKHPAWLGRFPAALGLCSGRSEENDFANFPVVPKPFGK